MSMQTFFTSFTFRSYAVDITTWATKWSVSRLSGLSDKVQITHSHLHCKVPDKLGRFWDEFLRLNRWSMFLSRIWRPAWDGRYSTVLWKLYSCIPEYVSWILDKVVVRFATDQGRRSRESTVGTSLSEERRAYFYYWGDSREGIPKIWF